MNYENFEIFRSAVINEVRCRMGWDSMCCDDLIEFYLNNDFEGAVQRVIDNTIYWEHLNEEVAPPFSDLLDEYISTNDLERLEGETGLANLNKICEAIGYRQQIWANGSPIEGFLMDNPGAAESLIEWIKEQNIEGWRESIESKLSD